MRHAPFGPVPLGISYAMTKYSPTAGGQRYFIEGVATQGRKG